MSKSHYNIDDLILWEDDNMLALSKPAGLVSERDSSGMSQPLAVLLKKKNRAWHLCHRLDKETSGIIMAAKNDEAYRCISLQFQNREITKLYHLLISKPILLQDKAIQAPIRKTQANRAVIDHVEGKPATTIFNTLEQFTHYSLLQAQPISGRYHQIRIHMASAGFPLLCDTLYGGELLYLSQLKRNYRVAKSAGEELPIMQRTCLHSTSIQFKDLAGVEHKVDCPYPKDFRVAVELIRKHDSQKIMS